MDVTFQYITLSFLWTGMFVEHSLLYLNQVIGLQSGPIHTGKLICGETCSQNNTFRTLNGVGVQACAEECHRRKRCTSFNYYHAFNHCELNHERHRKTTMLIPTVPSPCVFSDITTWTFPQNSICDGNYCQDFERCDHFNTVNKTAVCSVEECDLPKENDHSHLQSSIVAIGKTNLYECDYGYRPKGKKRSTCLENGQWSFKPNCIWFCADYEFSIEDNICYFLTNSMDFFSANSVCKNANGRVIKMASYAIQRFVVRVMKQNDIDKLGLGLKSELGSYENYAILEPNGHMMFWSEDCLDIVSIYNYKWRDIRCGKSCRYICQVFY